VDLRDTEAEAGLRAELRGWLSDAVPSLPERPHPDDWPARRAFDCSWQSMLFDAGYAGIHWPAEFGGRGASPNEYLIFLEESERAGAPGAGVNFVGLQHAGPTIAVEGTPDQRTFHLPGILKGEHVWCQGFSEPSAGSDLASLRTRAVRDGDHYVISGQKIWTSNGHVADYCEMLVRTDLEGPKQRGITWLIVPMRSDGIEARPLRTIQGTTEFCELFLDEVRVPVANRVGAENDGWRVANVTLSFERGTGLVLLVMQSMELLRLLAVRAPQMRRLTGSAWEDSGLRRDIGRLGATFDALWALAKRNIALAESTGSAGALGSVLKIRLADALHELADVSMRVLGEVGLSLDGVDGSNTGPHIDHALYAFALSIAGGSSQVQRNIVAERMLGLPKEPPWPSS
jgi:alkylation response protein AidB-like acyl-CoA dehydrogenase